MNPNSFGFGKAGFIRSESLNHVSNLETFLGNCCRKKFLTGGQAGLSLFGQKGKMVEMMALS